MFEGCRIMRVAWSPAFAISTSWDHDCLYTDSKANKTYQVLLYLFISLLESLFASKSSGKLSIGAEILWNKSLDKVITQATQASFWLSELLFFCLSTPSWLQQSLQHIFDESRCIEHPTNFLYYFSSKLIWIFEVASKSLQHFE